MVDDDAVSLLMRVMEVDLRVVVVTEGGVGWAMGSVLILRLLVLPSAVDVAGVLYEINMK